MSSCSIAAGQHFRGGEVPWPMRQTGLAASCCSNNSLTRSGTWSAAKWRRREAPRSDRALLPCPRRHPPDGVVGIASDVECRYPDRAERRADRAARSIPGEGGLHRHLVAEYGKMGLDRGPVMATAAFIWSAMTGAAASPGRWPIVFRTGSPRSPCLRTPTGNNSGRCCRRMP